jgi:hypothetical protein
MNRFQTTIGHQERVPYDSKALLLIATSRENLVLQEGSVQQLLLLSSVAQVRRLYALGSQDP